MVPAVSASTAQVVVAVVQVLVRLQLVLMAVMKLAELEGLAAWLHPVAEMVELAATIRLVLERRAQILAVVAEVAALVGLVAPEHEVKLS